MKVIRPFLSNRVNAHSYVSYRVHTPKPDTSSQDSLKNNPAVILYRKKGSKVIQHSEIIEEKCSETNCSNKLCDTTCSPVKEAKAIAHLGHSKEHNTNIIAPNDVNGENIPQYIAKYNKAHTVESQSAHPQIDEEKTKRLLKMLRALEKDNNENT